MIGQFDYETITVRFQGSICFIRFDRPDANNTINDRLVEEFASVLDECKEDITIIVLEGSAEVFCFGADFASIGDSLKQQQSTGEKASVNDPEPMYTVWQQLQTGPFITIAHVRGKANAGGIGFVAACDIVIAEEKAVFSLSELLFGLMPACVLPFLVRRMGVQKAHYMTLLTQPVTAQQALIWGLADVVEADSNTALRKHLLRMRHLSKISVTRYKRYINDLAAPANDAKQLALNANKLVFSDPQNLRGILRYVEEGKFPWES